MPAFHDRRVTRPPGPFCGGRLRPGRRVVTPSRKDPREHGVHFGTDRRGFVGQVVGDRAMPRPLALGPRPLLRREVCL